MAYGLPQLGEAALPVRYSWLYLRSSSREEYQGQSAYSVGRMIEFGGSPYLQVDGGRLVIPPDGSIHSASMLVGLRSVRSPNAFAHYDGLRVVATGRWEDESFAVEDLAEAAPVPATDRRAPSSDEQRPGAARK